MPFKTRDNPGLFLAPRDVRSSSVAPLKAGMNIANDTSTPSGPAPRKRALLEQAASGVFWSAIQKWAGRVISLGVFLLLARLLNPQAFGLVALAGVFVAFMEIFLDQGFADAIVQRADLAPGHLDTAFWTNLGLGLVFLASGVLGAGFIASLFDEPTLGPVIRWLSLSFILAALIGVQKALLLRDLAFRLMAAASVTAIAVGGIVGVGMALTGFGVWSLVGQQLVSRAVEAAVFWRVNDWRPGFRVSRQHFRDLFGYGINVVGMKLLSFFSTRTLDLLIGAFLGTVALGYYNIAFRIVAVLSTLISGTVRSVAFPLFARLQAELGRMRRGFYTATRLTSVIALPTFVGLAVIAPELIIGLIGAKWAPSVRILQVLAFIGILEAITYFNGAVIQASGKPSWSLGLRFLNVIGNLIGFAIAVRWGVVAVALAYVLRGYLLMPLSVWAAHKLIHFDLRTYVRQYTAPLFASVVMALVVVGAHLALADLRLGLYAQVATSIVVGVLAYASLIWMFARDTSHQILKILRAMLPQPT